MDTAMDRRPAHGARFELLRQGVDEESAQYLAQVYVPGARFDFQLRIAWPGGACQVTPLASVPPQADGPAPWVTAHLLTLARQVFRDAQKAHVGGPLSERAWQRRLMRWRDKS